MTKTLKGLIPIIIILAVGIFFRTYYINFGLPQSFYADEPEIAEPAIKYTYEIRNIVKNNDYYKLIPQSFVYGTFPVYLYTFFVMLFSKTMSVLSITFEKTTLYILMRLINSTISTLLIPLSAYLFYRMFKNKYGALLTAFLMALNWKFIVMSHYLNTDVILTILLLTSFMFMYFYMEEKKDTLFILLTGIFFGLAIGTKVTAALSLPLFLYVFLYKKDIKGFLAFVLISFGVFSLTNPFSIIFIRNFVFRTIHLLTKEGGMVFDSVDTNPFKYVFAVAYLTIPTILLFSLYGKLIIFKNFVNENGRVFHIFLTGNILTYLLFYSLSTRLVDRWLLPIIPIIIIYAAYGILVLKTRLDKKGFFAVCVITCISYLYFPILLLFQFQRQTPKSAAYIWMRDNTNPLLSKLVITEEGLDPMNKLLSSKVTKLNVYVLEGAQYDYPLDPTMFNYVLLSSRPMQNYKRREIQEKFPEYSKRWANFEKTVENPGNFKLIKVFKLPKPNLIPLSNVYIYENLKLSPTKGNL